MTTKRQHKEVFWLLDLSCTLIEIIIAQIVLQLLEFYTLPLEKSISLYVTLKIKVN